MKKYKRIKVIKICPKCCVEFEIERNVNDNGIEIIYKKERKHCSRKCANSNVHTKEWNDKISKALKGRTLIDLHGEKEAAKIKKNLSQILKEYVKHNPEKREYLRSKKVIEKRKKTKESRKELYKVKRIKYLQSLDYSNKQNYYLLCSFKFNIYEYPERFDLDLIKKYGWYKVKNRGDNPNGVNRDHMYSKIEGFRNKIDPSLISHPANCVLILHKENLNKNRKCSITLEELKERIKKW